MLKSVTMHLFFYLLCLTLSVWPVAAQLVDATTQTTVAQQQELTTQLQDVMKEGHQLLEQFDKKVMPQFKQIADTMHASSLAFIEKQKPAAQTAWQKTKRHFKKEAKNVKKSAVETKNVLVGLFDQMAKEWKGTKVYRVRLPAGQLRGEDKVVAERIAKELLLFADATSEADKKTLNDDLKKIDAAVAHKRTVSGASVDHCHALGKMLRDKKENDKETTSQMLTFLGVCHLYPTEMEPLVNWFLKDDVNDTEGLKAAWATYSERMQATKQPRLQKRSITEKEVKEMAITYAKNLDTFIRAHNRSTLLFAAAALMLGLVVPQALLPVIAGYLVLAAFTQPSDLTIQVVPANATVVVEGEAETVTVPLPQ